MDEQPTDSDHELQILRGHALAKPAGTSSPALSEMVSRSLVHIQTSKDLSKLHRIGEHELCTPDYQLVCAWAEECNMTPEEVLNRLFYSKKPEGKPCVITEIEAGKFTQIGITELSNLPIASLPFVKGLAIELLEIMGIDLTELDLSSVPNLTRLYCGEIEWYYRGSCLLNKLDLSPVPKMEYLLCDGNLLTELDLSPVPQLRHLRCRTNQLKRLDLSGATELEWIICADNQLTELDLRAVPELTRLDCTENQLTYLDITPLSNLSELDYDKDKIRLIQRPDQNF